MFLLRCTRVVTAGREAGSDGLGGAGVLLWARNRPAGFQPPVGQGYTGWRHRLCGRAAADTDGGGGGPARRIGAMRTLTLLGRRHALHGEAASMLPLAARQWLGWRKDAGSAQCARCASMRSLQRCMSCRAMRRGELPPREPHLPAAATRRRALANWVDRTTIVLLRRDRRRAVRAGRLQMVPADGAAARLATWVNCVGFRPSAALSAVLFGLRKSSRPVSRSSSQR